METRTLSTVYYKTMFGRKNQLSEKLLLFFLGLAPLFRMVPEVFLRRKMGRRYFNLSLALSIGFILGIVPVIYGNTISYSPSWYDVVTNNIPFYAFLSVYCVMCFIRNKDTKHVKGVFDFSEYTKSAGLIHPRLLAFKDSEDETNFRLIETVIEPLLIFSFGLMCLLVSMGLGLFMIFCAVVYRLSYAAQYNIGDNLIMDMIDKIVVGQEMEGIMTKGYSSDGNRGVRFTGTLPKNSNLRGQLWEAMTRKQKGDDGDNNDGVAL